MVQDEDCYLQVQVNGTWYYWDELNEKNIKVPQNAPVEVKLKFTNVTDVTTDTVLYYQIPTEMIGSVEPGQSGTIKDGSSVAGTYTISNTGLIELVFDSAYLSAHRDDATGKTTLRNGFVTFKGSLDEKLGEWPGDQEETIAFGPIKFTIPFEYRNYYGNVNIEKTSSIDMANKKITYTVTVKTPATNTLDAQNVKVEDTFTAGSNFISVSNGKKYTDVSADTGTFDASTGVWTIGTMTPNKTAKLTYTVKLQDTFFNGGGSTVTNVADVYYNQTGHKSDDSSQSCRNTVSIQKTNATVLLVGSDVYLEYTLTVKAPAGNESTVTDVTVVDQYNEVQNGISYENRPILELESNLTVPSGFGQLDSEGNHAPEKIR
jgi:uncharacterized repeat protein (TIGR01451 family)